MSSQRAYLIPKYVISKVVTPLIKRVVPSSLALNSSSSSAQTVSATSRLTDRQPDNDSRACCNINKYRPLLTLNAPIATKVVCFSRLLKCLRSLYGKQCGPRSDCSYRSSLFWVHAVCFYTYSSVMLGNYLQQTTSADDIFRCIFLSWRFKG